MASAAAQWLAGVPLSASKTLFFIGADQAALGAELSARGWQGRVIALAPPDFSGLDALASTIDADAEQPVVALDPAMMRAHRDAVKQAARQIARVWFGARANRDAKQRNGAIYRANTLRNAPAIAREADAAVLRDAFAGLPAVVIGAGPSLDRNIADLVAYRDRALIIAADTAVRPLLAAGIDPHFVVEADPSEINARHLCELRPDLQAALVAEGSVDPESLRAFEGRTFFYRVGDHDPWPWLTGNGLDCGRLRSWGSVLTTAFDLARVIGCSRIVFAGADLAFTHDRPYARGTTYEEIWYQSAYQGQPIESSWAVSIGSWTEAREVGIDGASVRTAPHLQSFRDWIATEAAKLPAGVVINATGDGILHGPGMAQAALAATLASFDAIGIDVRARIAALHERGKRNGSIAPAVETAASDAWHHQLPDAPAKAAGQLETAPDPAHAELRLESGDLLPQIEAAWAVLSDDRHRLILIDRTGVIGGASVRRALFAFLETHPGVSAHHGRFFDPKDDRSWIDRRPITELNPGEDRSKWAPEHAAIAERLAPLIVETLAPRSVLDVGCGAGYWLQALRGHGVNDVEGVEEALPTYVPARRFDVSLCLGVVQRVPMSTAEHAIATCVAASDTVVFSVPSAAIGAAGFINERPSIVWHRLFLQHGFAAFDELRPQGEERWGQYLSSFDLLIVYRRVAEHGDAINAASRAAMLAAAQRADDLVLQRHYLLASRAAVASTPHLAQGALAIPPVRMESGPAGARLFRFRTAAAGLALDPKAIVVEEEGEPLRRVPTVEEVGNGAFAISGGAIVFRSTDGLDPRLNGRVYSVRMPAHLAFIENASMETIVAHHL